jgi:hypothetical protein
MMRSQSIITLTLSALLLAGPLAARAGNVCNTQAALINPLAQELALQKPGLGGTGMLAGAPGLGGTGIVGIITGFASICVNGVEVQYEANTPMSDNGDPGSARTLAVGQMVVINAAGSGDEVQARQLSLLHMAIAPIESVNLQKNELMVLGQTVTAAPGVSLRTLQAGQWVRVSGLRTAQGTVQATHLQVVSAPAPAQAQWVGTVQHTAAASFSVDGVTVTLARQSWPQGLTSGSEVMVRGHWNQTSLEAASITLEPTRTSLGNVTHVVMEGYVRATSSDSVTIGSQRLQLAADLPANERAQLQSQDAKVHITARMDAQHQIQVQRVERARPVDAHTPAKPAAPTAPPTNTAAESKPPAPTDVAHSDAPSSPVKTPGVLGAPSSPGSLGTSSPAANTGRASEAKSSSKSDAKSSARSDGHR